MRHLVYFCFGWVFVVGLVVSRGATPPYEITLDRNIQARMRDGVVLRADVYRPKTEGKFPVILERTPYDKKDYGVDFGLRAAARGYVFVIQDCRGRYNSDGEWEPFKYESNDGYDSVEWAASLPYSNGKVATYGASYVGVTQMLLAIAAPPHLAGIFPMFTASNYHDNWVYQGGAFEQWFNESWPSSSLAPNLTERMIARQRDTNFLLSWVQKLPLLNFPLSNLPGHGNFTSYLPFLGDWLKHPRYDDYWKRWSIDEHRSSIKVPAYHVGGWYDIFLGGTLRNYAGIKAHAATPEARSGQRLLIFLGGHAGFGDFDFGPQAAKVDTDGLVLRWYDHLLKGIENGIDKEKPVRIFVMGENVWRDETEWPPADAVATRFYLHSAGGANSLSGDGTLSMDAPGARKADSFIYDPINPTPTRGGPLCCPLVENGQPAVQLLPGPRDQRPVESRNDVLVYATPPLKQDLEVTGPVSLELYASSSAVDTDFTAKLIDVWPNGVAQNLTEGILRARYRNSEEREEFLTPGEIYKFAIDLWATSNLFKAGHRIRVEISSSNFPRFDRNLNTGEEQAYGTRVASATNSIYHDAEHPSAIILPVENPRVAH